MAKNLYRSAQGKIVDMDKLRLSNEQTIAIGNMKTNARGDQLGAGGQVVRTRAEVMKEYYALNTNVAAEDDDGTFEPPQASPEIQADPTPPTTKLKTPVATEEAPQAQTAKKSSLADQVAEDLANKGIQRI